MSRFRERARAKLDALIDWLVALDCWLSCGHEYGAPQVFDDCIARKCRRCWWWHIERKHGDDDE